MSVLALGLAETSALDERLAEKSLAALQAQALARSGVAVAAVVLAETGAAETPDTLRAPWAVGVGRQPLGAGWVEVHVEDEARRLDLNAPELADAVPRLLALLGLDPGLADALADWTDAGASPRPRYDRSVLMTARRCSPTPPTPSASFSRRAGSTTRCGPWAASGRSVGPSRRRSRRRRGWSRRSWRGGPSRGSSGNGLTPRAAA